MRKKIVLLATIVSLIALAVILIFTRQPESRFDGERISTPGRYTLRFDRMNTVQSETMALAEGDALHVSWQIESGRVDIAIGIEGEEAIYRADDRPAGDKADFYVEIPQTGSYTITVSAREAKGQIEFMRMENEQREGE